jgi:hypothetical protein
MWLRSLKGDLTPESEQEKSESKAAWVPCCPSSLIHRVAIVVRPAPTGPGSSILPSSLSLEARVELQKEQALELNSYIYDLNARKQLSRPARTINTYAPKEKEFMVSSLRLECLR